MENDKARQWRAKRETEAIRVSEFRASERYTVSVEGAGERSTADMTKERIHLSVGAVNEPSPFSVKG